MCLFKKIRWLLLVVSLLFCSLGYSQNELGLPLSFIKDKFKEPKYELKQYREDDGTYTLAVKLEKAYLTYYFDKFNDTDSVVITPFDNNSLQNYISEYDSKYIRLNSDVIKWKAVTELVENLVIVEYIVLATITAEDGNSFYTLIWTFE